jgi:NDP-sugar pyrophosphorylase family protein
MTGRRHEIAGVVLAAGLGMRLRPLTDLVPKALCPVNHVPLVDLAVGHVHAVTADIAVNVHHHRERMEQHLATSAVSVRVSIEEPEALGTAGAVGLLRDWIDGRPTLVHNADVWYPPELDVASALAEGWDGERIRLLVVRPARDGQRDFGEDVTFAGVSLLPWGDVARLEPEPTGLWEVSWRQAQEDGRLDLVTLDPDAPWFDTGVPSAYLAANLAANDGRSVIAASAAVHPTATVQRSVVWPDAVVEAHEHLVEQNRAPGPITVDAALGGRA